MIFRYKKIFFNNITMEHHIRLNYDMTISFVLLKTISYRKNNNEKKNIVEQRSLRKSCASIFIVQFWLCSTFYFILFLKIKSDLKKKKIYIIGIAILVIWPTIKRSTVRLWTNCGGSGFCYCCKLTHKKIEKKKIPSNKIDKLHRCVSNWSFRRFFFLSKFRLFTI